MLVSGSSDQTIRLWDMDDDGICLATITGHLDQVTSIQVDDVHGRFLTGSIQCVGRGGHSSWGSGDEFLFMWSKTGQMISKLGPKRLYGCFGFTPDYRRVVSYQWVVGEIQIWEEPFTLTSLPAHTFLCPGKFTFYDVQNYDLMTFMSSDGNRLVVGGKDGVVRILDIRKGNPIKEIKSFKFSDAGCSCVAVSRGDDSFVYGDKAGNVIGVSFFRTDQNLTTLGTRLSRRSSTGLAAMCESDEENVLPSLG